ncbi:hypothetical protein IXO627_20635 [Xanthomonas oryzae pv. oryzae]|nr:hypothetical protein IXO627_20635 [Xanthomonas oryzae pv. oryzae]
MEFRGNLDSGNPVSSVQIFNCFKNEPLGFGNAKPAGPDFIDFPKMDIDSGHIPKKLSDRGRISVDIGRVALRDHSVSRKISIFRIPLPSDHLRISQKEFDEGPRSIAGLRQGSNTPNTRPFT